MIEISGTFEVRMSPQADPLDAEGIGRFRLDKQYHGPLIAIGTGVMIAHRTTTEGSAGYAAIERVRGTLEGRTGSLVLQHAGAMDRGSKRLQLDVIADSADGEWLGLRGTMDIRIEGGVHYYDFRYHWPE